jgi:hypothetical protein
MVTCARWLVMNYIDAIYANEVFEKLANEIKSDGMLEEGEIASAFVKDSWNAKGLSNYVSGYESEFKTYFEAYLRERE